MKTRDGAWLFAVGVLLSAQPAAAQPAEDLKALRQDVETLKQEQSTIHKELQEIKELLRVRPAPPQLVRPAAPAPPQDLALDLAGAPAKGATAARLTMVEYTDYQ